MTELSVNAQTSPASGWKNINLKTLIMAGSGLLAVLIALKVAAHGNGGGPALADHFYRFAAFGSLTLWMTFAIGIERRNFLAIFVLAFASFCELFLLQLRGDALGTLASANLGIVVAYALLELYASRIKKAPASADA